MVETVSSPLTDDDHNAALGGFLGHVVGLEGFGAAPVAAAVPDEPLQIGRDVYDESEIKAVNASNGGE
jgi:hypothetical protein